MTIIKGKTGKVNFILRDHRLSDAESLFKFQQDSDIQNKFISIPKDMLKKEERLLINPIDLTL